MKASKQAFTLIELLIVVLIIGILAAVALPQYQVAVAKSRTTELLTLARHIKTQQEVYYLANGTYAQDCQELAPDLPGGTVPTDDGYEYIETSGIKIFGLICKIVGNTVEKMILFYF